MTGSGTPAVAPGLEVLRDIASIEGIADEWRSLAVAAGGSAFESPDWLLPWFRHYARDREPWVLTWRDGGRLVGLAPLVAWRRGRPAVSQLAFWGGFGPALRGMVDLVALEGCREVVRESFDEWLRTDEAGWDLLHALRLPAGSATPARLLAAARRAGWRRIRLTGVVRSETWIVDLPDDPDAPSLLGPKARHNLRTEARRFGRAGGSYEVLSDAASVVTLPAILRRFSIDRWGEREVNFAPDPAFEPFLEEAVPRLAAAGSLYANVARDGSGIRACLVTFLAGARATAVLIGVDTADDIRRHSLGKHLFDASIREAIGRGCTTYDFLWEGGYKESFWKARPRVLESLVLGRGVTGGAAVAWVALRRRLVPGLRARLRSGGGATG